MKTIYHKSDTRGHFNFGWLDTRHTFSFARYYDPERVNFGALRVLNDDIIAPARGFDKHPHDNMEIISIPIYGSLKHKDSTGNEQVIHDNEVQVMSAGTGVFHSEYNGSDNEKTNFLQIWIIPKAKNIEPVYDQREFDFSQGKHQWQTLVSSRENDEGGLKINQDVTISRVELSKEKSIDYKLSRTSYGSYLFIINGKVEVGDHILEKRDGLGITETDNFSVKALENAIILNIEVPIIE